MKSPLLQENVTLAPFTTLGVGGPARFFCEAATESDVQEAVGLARVKSWPLFVLGGGSNVLASDSGFPGLVLRVATRGVKAIESDLLAVSAGEDWDSFVQLSVEKGLAGLECLSGIPGTVGGTPIQNVGAYGAEVGDTIASVRVLSRSSGEIMDLDRQACGFSYRGSIFSGAQQDRFVVLGVTFQLRADPRPRIAYPELMRFLGEKAASASLAEVRQAVMQIRRGKGMILDPTDPESRTAGSFFKNPVLDADRCASIEEAARQLGVLDEAGSMPRFAAGSGCLKIPAAWLIEGAGFRKGFRKGHVAISSRHALALVALAGATAAEVLDLAQEIRERVEERFGLSLEFEPVLIGF
ncbi:MAG: UDP-N-acetylmuramate dehydrogenase [Acidobacteria bacterium]|nr:UDP-N-acetylmuramate dehydrogenase [Acidobacteriota bacterium]